MRKMLKKRKCICKFTNTCQGKDFSNLKPNNSRHEFFTSNLGKCPYFCYSKAQHFLLEKQSVNANSEMAQLSSSLSSFHLTHNIPLLQTLTIQAKGKRWISATRTGNKSLNSSIEKSSRSCRANFWQSCVWWYFVCL